MACETRWMVSKRCRMFLTNQRASCSRTASVAPPSSPVRWLLLAFAVACIGLGIVGVFVPGMPTTVFVILAAWAATRSSPRLHGWLLGHPEG